MKFTVEIEDFWCDEDTNIEDELKSSIINSVVHKIKADIKDAIDTQIREVVQQQILDNMATEIAMVTRSVVNTETVKNPYNSNERVTIKDLVVKTVEQKGGGWANPIKELEKYAHKHMEQIKSHYDFLFASSIVKKMAEQGMLKDDNIAKLMKEEG